MRELVLLVEGEGDREAVPILIRNIFHAASVYNVTIQPRIMMVGNVSKLRRPGELERHLKYADQNRGCAIILVQDCEDQCPVVVAEEYRKRALDIRPPIIMSFYSVFLVREFETLFLHSAHALSTACPDFQWCKELDPPAQGWGAFRDSKKHSKKMWEGKRGYRELRDQGRLAAQVDLDALRLNSRSFRHLEKVLLGLGKLDPD